MIFFVSVGPVLGLVLFLSIGVGALVSLMRNIASHAHKKK